MTLKEMRQRAELLDVLTALLRELPEIERDAATVLVSWAAREIAAAKLDEPDQVYLRAVDLVAKEKCCSVSWLQRKLAIGYGVAPRVVEEMEARGVVGPAGGSQDRKVLSGRHP